MLVVMERGWPSRCIIVIARPNVINCQFVIVACQVQSQVRFTVTHFRSSRLAAFSSLVGLSICLGGFHCTASEEGRFTIVMRLKRGSHCFQHHHEAYLERILFISSSQSSIAFARSPLSIARREGTRERSSQWSRARCAVHHVMCSIHDCGMFAFSCNESQLSE